nr:ANTAR domain-containing protein [Mycobacterium sp. 3519A]
MSTNADTLSRRAIDMAIGVLMGLRHCTERQAFDEIACAVNQTGMSLGQVCRELVELASGLRESATSDSPIIAIWGELIRGCAAQSDYDANCRRRATPSSIPRASSSTSGAVS